MRLFSMLGQNQRDACSNTLQKLAEIEQIQDLNSEFMKQSKNLAAEQFIFSEPDIRAWAETSDGVERSV